MRKFVILAVSVVLLAPGFAFGHPGRTASDGCHYCRTNCSSWGEAWDQRHCHNGYSAPVYTAPTPRPTPRLTPRPTPLPTPKPETNISAGVQNSQTAYYQNPHWFREKLISDLIKEFGSQYSNIIGRLVYTLLPDVKN